MCIPCVMCGACMDGESREHADDGRCPECGKPVPNDAVSCPHCFTFLYRTPAAPDGLREAGRNDAVGSHEAGHSDETPSGDR